MRKTMSESAVAPAFSRCRIVVMSSSSPPGGVPPRADTASVSVWLTVGGAMSEAPGCSRGNSSVHCGRCRAASCKVSLSRLIRRRHKCLRASASISDHEGRHCPTKGEQASSLRGRDLR